MIPNSLTQNLSKKINKKIKIIKKKHCYCKNQDGLKEPLFLYVQLPVGQLWGRNDASCCVQIYWGNRGRSCHTSSVKHYMCRTTINTLSLPVTKFLLDLFTVTGFLKDYGLENSVMGLPMSVEWWWQWPSYIYNWVRFCFMKTQCSSWMEEMKR